MGVFAYDHTMLAEPNLLIPGKMPIGLVKLSAFGEEVFQGYYGYILLTNPTRLLIGNNAVTALTYSRVESINGNTAYYFGAGQGITLQALAGKRSLDGASFFADARFGNSYQYYINYLVTDKGSDNSGVGFGMKGTDWSGAGNSVVRPSIVHLGYSTRDFDPIAVGNDGVTHRIAGSTNKNTEAIVVSDRGYRSVQANITSYSIPNVINEHKLWVNTAYRTDVTCSYTGYIARPLPESILQAIANDPFSLVQAI